MLSFSLKVWDRSFPEKIIGLWLLQFQISSCELGIVLGFYGSPNVCGMVWYVWCVCICWVVMCRINKREIICFKECQILWFR